MMRNLILTVASIAGLALTEPAAAQTRRSPERPTIVLVHGAFAESSSWNKVITELLADGYPVIAAATPLRSVRGDGAYVASILATIKGPVVLVGQSYGGQVISAAAEGAPNVKGLVYVSGYALDVGESATSMSARFPQGTLGQALAPPVRVSGGNDLYIEPAKYHAQFASDVPADEAAQMAATQRPVTEAALQEPVRAAPWKRIPSWFVYGSLDRNIPATAHAFMAARARAKGTLGVDGASHVVMISHPEKVADMIERAASAQ